MYGDTDVIRRHARALRARAHDIRAEADRLVGLADAVPWDGLAAHATRLRARERAGALRRTAWLHEDAALALERHAAEVDRLIALIALLEQRVTALVAAAQERLSDLAARVLAGLPRISPDPLDEWLAGFQPPPPGDREWLHLELPAGLAGLMPVVSR